MSKTKLLIVSSSLAQGGNERWIFEICKALDKEKFEIGILCSKNYSSMGKKQSFSNFYQDKLEKLNVPLFKYLDVSKQTFWKRGVNKLKRILNKTLSQWINTVSKEIRYLLKDYEVVCIIDYYNYFPIKQALHQFCEGRFFVLLHTHKVQLDFDLYDLHFDKQRRYNFAYFAPKQISEIAESGFDTEKNSFFYAPLVLDLSGYTNLFNPIEADPIVISVFSRITRARPLEKILEAFSKLEKQLKRQLRLNFYGEIIDQSYHQQLLQLAQTLEINDKAFSFLGHALDIAETIKQDRVNICWGLSNNAVIGYGSIEVETMGVPSFYWDLDENADLNEILLKQSDNSIIVYNKVDDFVAVNVKYLSSNKLLAELSLSRRQYVIKNHDISNRIKEFEDYVEALKPTRNDFNS